MTRSARVRHAKICSRSYSHGIGSCWWWWESCPRDIAGCSLRMQRAALEQLPDHIRAMAAIVDEALGG